MNYSLKHIFSQEPMNVSAAFMAVVNAALLWAGFVDVTAEQLAATDVSLVLLLGLFYVRPLTASKAALTELTENTEVVEAAMVVDKPRKRKR